MMGAKPVLFLDIDGVLNSRALFKASPGGALRVCSEACRRLASVIEVSGACVVLSSTWRKDTSLRRRLVAAGILKPSHRDWRTRVDMPCIENDKGIIVSWPSRGDEIQEWLSRHPEVTTYAIVDDDNDMLNEQKPFFVQTDFETGLLDNHCEKLLAILSPTKAPEKAAAKIGGG